VSKIIIFGNSSLASLAYVYLKHDSPHEPVAFTVDSAYMTTDRHFELPVVPFDNIEKSYLPDEFEMFLPISFRQMSDLRANKYLAAKAKGYTLISYIGSKATIWPEQLLSISHKSAG
jgi:hypothetical protein